MDEVLTVDEVAAILKVSVYDVQREVLGGKMHAVTVGTHMRIPRGALEAYLGVAQALVLKEWTSLSPFDFKWPDGGSEHQDKAYTTTRVIKGDAITFTVGFAWRHTIGQLRRRVTVFTGSAKSRKPLVEFVGSDNFEADRVLVSIIKGDNGKHVYDVDALPQGYDPATVAPYNQHITGPYAPSGLAMVASEADLDAMLSHAIIRYRMRYHQVA